MDQKENALNFGKLIFTNIRAIGNNQVNNSQYFIVTASDKSQLKEQNAMNSHDESKDVKRLITYKNYLIIEHNNNDFLLNSDFDFEKIRESYLLQQKLAMNCPAILPVYKILDLEKDRSFQIASKFLKKGILSTYLPGFTVHPNQLCTFEKLNPTKKTIIAYGIAQSMKYIHSQQIFYHNLTPDSIFLDDNYYPYLTDFYKCVENANEIILQNDIFNYSIIYVSLFGAIEIVRPNSNNDEFALSSSESNEFEKKSLIHIISSMRYGARPRLDNKLDMTESQKKCLMVMFDPNHIKLTFHDIIQLFENGDLVFTGTDLEQFDNYKKLFDEPHNNVKSVIDDTKEFCYFANVPLESDD